MSDERTEYNVGYGKPPKVTRWKTGESGNPNGRPKKTRDIEKLFARELDATIRITEHGQTKTITKREALVKTMINDALKGNKQAYRIVLNVMQNSAEIDGFVPDPEDRKAFESFLSRFDGGGGDEGETDTGGGGEESDG
ncbi:hypothetical protein JYT11_00685 [Planctomycetaceae bacterium AH-315-I19]|nr:hypothetical protein [Planctomycetaceae bacterium AH-315-I19]